MRSNVPRALLLAAALLAAAADAAPAAGGGERRPPSGPLERLAGAVQDDSDLVRADFAALALDQVIIAHELEFERLSVPGQVSRRELAKQARWAGALRAFLDELYAARDELDAGAAVQIVVSPPSPVQLLLGTRLVPLTGPRLDDPRTLEADIVQLYCATFTCAPELLEAAPPESSGAVAQGGWSFRDGRGSTYETVDGLGFMFADVRRRSVKEQVCRQVREDLLRLVAALTARRDAGRAVDYSALRVLDTPRDGGLQRVEVATGATLRLHLPALARAPGVLSVAREWIRAQVQGRDYRQLFPRADLMLAGLLE